MFRSTDTFLKNGYMENKINGGNGGKIKLVSHLPHMVENFEGSKESSTKLVMSLEAYEVLAKRLKFDINLVSFLENHLLMVYVSHMFHSGLCFGHTLPEKIEYDISVEHKFLNLLIYLAIVGSYRP